MQIRGQGLLVEDPADDTITAAATAAEEGEGEKRVYVLHPNCAVEEM